jgi:hypothetical protein
MSFWTGETLCSIGTGRGAEPPPGMSPGRTIWTVTGDYLGEQDGRHQLKVTSKFVRLGGRDAATATTQTLALRDGDEVTLDAVTEPVLAPTCKVHVVTFDARVVMRPSDPVLARTTYTADLWLVHDGPFEAQLRERLIINVDGTVTMPFRFGQMTFTVPQVDPRQRNISAAILLSGAMRARTRTDGQVDLDLETNRHMYGLSNLDGLPTLTSPLRKTLTLRPGETMAVDFPPPSSGFTSMSLQPSGGGSSGTGRSSSVRVEGGRARVEPPGVAPADTVSVKNDWLTLNTAAFFRGHKTQLLVTLKPLR